MKKYFYLVLAICLPMMFVCSCGNDDEVEPTTQSQTGNADNPGSQTEDIVPHNEIWYTASSKLVEVSSSKSGKGAYESGLQINLFNTSISSHTFKDGQGVIKFDEDVTSTEEAFYKCNSLLSVTFPNSVTSIGNSAFYGCSRLVSITIPNSVTSIGGSAFWGCSSLASITIPNSVTRINSCTFSGCSSLSSITIPNSVTSIEGYAFEGCSSLPSIIIPNSVTSIEGYAFYGCSSLASITIPNSVTSIGGGSVLGGGISFVNCNSLTSIIVASGNTKLDSRNNCNAIIETSTNTLIAGCKNTIIPNSVTSIGYGAFWECSSLASITIPNSVTSIGGCAFSGCSSLTSITIPNSVTSIGLSVFSFCSSLTSVYVCWQTPLRVSSDMGPALFSNQSNATLYVPRGTKAAYQSANVWKDFKEIVEWDAQ